MKIHIPDHQTVRPAVEAVGQIEQLFQSFGSTLVLFVMLVGFTLTFGGLVIAAWMASNAAHRRRPSTHLRREKKAAKTVYRRDGFYPNGRSFQ